MVDKRKPQGLPLILDDAAASADPVLPAFLARPPGAPVYHGFPVLEDVEIDGFRLGLISNSLSARSNWGDAFVVAPDGRRAGIVWELSESWTFSTLLEADAGRWGVFAVGTPHGPWSVNEAHAFLAEIVARLRQEWERSRPDREVR